MRTAAFALFLAGVIAAPALAQDEPQATGPAAGPPSVAEQIDDFLRASPAAAIEDDAAAGVTARADRRVRGEVAVGVGSHGYRSVYMRGDVPVGESGRLSVAIGDTRFGRGHPLAGDRLGVLGIDRRRCGLEAMTPERPLDPHYGPCRSPFGP